MLKMALLINVIIVFCEVCTLSHIRKKRDILKYYTYLQNLIALFTSAVLILYMVIHRASSREMPAFLSGIRYVATCGLAATTVMFLTFLGGGKKNPLKEDDFLLGFSPRIANAVLHYICPALSLVSFVLFERELPLPDGIWTGLAAVPSCLYWIIYMILSAAKWWEEPYDFAAQEGKGKVWEVLPFILIPLMFVAVSFVLWTVRSI